MISDTKICNMALGKIGSKRINDILTDTSPQAQQCRLHFEQTRDSLIRSHFWRFASARRSLSQDTVDPDFEYESQFILPTDFLRRKSVFGDTGPPMGNTRFTYAIEGNRLLTNDNSVDLRYIKRVTDPTKFDPLFVEVLVLHLALKFVASLSGGSAKLQATIQNELKAVMPQVRALDRQETNTIGRNDLSTWNDSRVSLGGARIDSQLGS